MITPVLLCGGSGTRLWPVSRKSYPKQFVALVGEESLFQSSARRLSGPGFAAPMVVTGSDFRFIVAEQLLEAGIDPGIILIEPSARNTAPAVLAAALALAQEDPDGLMLVAPSDHVVPDGAAFRAAVEAGRTAAEQGAIVTFGIAPTHPETGYGWLELSATPEAGELAPVPLQRFVEKPDFARATAMFEAGHFLWNAGIFLFKVSTILEAFRAHAPGLLEPVQLAVEQARTDLGFLRLNPEAFAGAEAISIDYAVMERASNLMAVPFSAGWSDLGGWDAVAREMGEDGNHVSLGGDAIAIDCENSLLRADGEGLAIVGIGLKDIIAVAMNDAVLVADRSRAQDVKLAVEELKARGLRQAEEFQRDYRPWGWLQTLAASDRFQVKRIVVNPGASLSLQSHMHRSEHWIVVSGTARVTLDGEMKLVTENQSVYVPLGTMHRLENPGKVPMVLIEVRTGSYIAEDDITRYEDVYDRGSGPRG